MFKHRVRAPSPAFVISLIALFLALGGTSYAATKVILTKHKDAKADTTLVKRLAPSLSVKHAKTANNATNATNATNAVNATHATSADSASRAAATRKRDRIDSFLGRLGTCGFYTLGSAVII